MSDDYKLKAEDIMYELDKISNENTLAIKEVLITDLLNKDYEYVLLFNIMAQEVIKSLRPQFNNRKSGIFITNLKRYFNTGVADSLSSVEMSLINTLTNASHIGMRRSQVYVILNKTSNIMDVHTLLYEESLQPNKGCDLCGSSIGTEATLCDHCIQWLNDRLEFRSEDMLKLKITPDNFNRYSLVRSYTTFNIMVRGYSITKAQHSLICTRKEPIKDAKLPFKEYY